MSRAWRKPLGRKGFRAGQAVPRSPARPATTNCYEEEEVRKAKAQKKAIRAKDRKNKVNVALQRAGIPLRVL